MKILLVGAGAVGQVYGRHLQQGGAKISYFVKEKHAANLRSGLTVYPLDRRNPWEPVPYYGYGTLTELSEVREQTWDQVWLCMSSTALHGEWIDPFLEAIGDATVVSLQPGLRDQDFLLQRIPAERLVTGLIGFIAFQAPLADEPVERVGIAYTFPPLSDSPFSGPKAAVQELVRVLRLGGCKARKVRNVRNMMAVASAFAMPIIASLQGAKWSFAGLRKSDMLVLGTRAAREGSAIAATYVGRSKPWLRLLVRPFLVSIVTRIAPLIFQFSIETFLRVHFTKVGDQTRAMLRSYIEESHRLELPSGALQELEHRVFGSFDSPAD